jgi:hypothetical protein
MKIRKSLLVEAAKDRPQGYLEDVYAYVESEDLEFVYISNDNYMLLKNKYTVEHGLPGTELKKLISWFYSPDKRKCKCATRIAKMNKWGPDGCEQRMDTILRWLKHSARINNIPYFELAVRILVRKAIKNSRLQLQQLPGKTAPLPIVSPQSKPADGTQ